MFRRIKVKLLHHLSWLHILIIFLWQTIVVFGINHSPLLEMSVLEMHISRAWTFREMHLNRCSPTQIASYSECIYFEYFSQFPMPIMPTTTRDQLCLQNPNKSPNQWPHNIVRASDVSAKCRVNWCTFRRHNHCAVDLHLALITQYCWSVRLYQRRVVWHVAFKCTLLWARRCPAQHGTMSCSRTNRMSPQPDHLVTAITYPEA